MTVYIQFGIFFLQLAFAASEVIAGVLLAREALRRRGQRHLSLFSIYFIIVGIGALLSFLGGFFDSQGFVGTGRVLSSLFAVFTVVGSFFYVVAFTSLYTKGITKHLLNLILLVLAIVALVIGERAVTEAFGVYLAVGSAYSFALSYSYCILTNAFAAVLAVMSCRRSKSGSGLSCPSDRFLAIGSLFVVAIGILAMLIISAGILWAAMLVYAALTLTVTYKYLGANAKNHPDPEISQHPYNAIKGTLMGKVLLVSAAFFALLTFALLAATSNFFVNRSLLEQEFQTRTALQNSVDGIQSLRESLLFDAVIFARHDEGLAVLTGEGAMKEDIVNFSEIRFDDRWMDIVDMQGAIVASSSDWPNESRELENSTVVMMALQGEDEASTEWDSETGTWIARAASTVRDRSGSIRGAVVISRPMFDWSLPACFRAPTMPFSGCGYVARIGETVVATGTVPDALTLDLFRSSIDAQIGVGKGKTDDVFNFFVQKVGSKAGEHDGFVYSFILKKDFEEELFRVLSTVVVVTALFLSIALILLAFGMALILRPLRMLKAVADRVSSGDYGISVEYESPDEIGKLAAAFNHMSLTIRDRTKSLNERVREQRDFLSHTAHEIRTPLNIFRWSLEMLRFGDTGKLNNEQMELVEQMHQTNERVRVMVEELLSVSRMDRGVIKLVRESTELEDIIDEVAGAFSVRIREKMIDFYWKHPDTSLPKVFVDKKRMYQVVMNLIGNAVKFTGKGGHIFVTATESDTSGPSGRDGRFVHVQVEDNGRGIPGDQHKFIFKRFFRAKNVLDEDIEGTGLGLHITRHFIDMHGGEIWFESEENAGSTFHFTVPVAEDES
ncbi:MAG: MFS domain-containing histidine kinase [Patescibacteria group bacterium]|nr:MFS domain-containing histidine kinase [Patescibacteria group bacterium]